MCSSMETEAVWKETDASRILELLIESEKKKINQLVLNEIYL